jgi:hypothetical protein
VRKEDEGRGRKDKSTVGAERMAGTPTLPTQREESGTHGNTSEKAGPKRGPEPRPFPHTGKSRAPTATLSEKAARPALDYCLAGAEVAASSKRGGSHPAASLNW